MRKTIAWLMLFSVLGFGGYRIWDRNTQPAAPVAIEQVQPAPAPSIVQAPEPVKPVAKKRRHRADPPTAREQDPRPSIGIPRSKGKNAQAPAPAPTYSLRTRGIRIAKPREQSADNGALPVSCATVRWYAQNNRVAGEKLAAQFHPNAAQIAAAKACLKG